MQPLISVIVPVYKVEKELPVCVNSILKQTYKNIEILLIDDGSPDGCGAICDDFADKYSNVKVFHKENGGLSDARNYGISRCKGSYITCVDSDDILKKNFIETLLAIAEKYDADMVVSPYQKFINEAELFIETQHSDNCVDVKKALQLLLYQDKTFHTGAHCKLYKSDLFDKIEYPVGLYYEDLATTYRLMMKCRKIAYTSEQMYGYRIRSESIMRQGFSPKMLSCITVSRQLYADINKAYPDLLNETSSRAFSVNRAIYLQMPHEKKEERKAVWTELKKYRKIVLKDKNSRKREKIMAFCSFFGAEVFSLFSIPYRKQQMQVK